MWVCQILFYKAKNKFKFQIDCCYPCSFDINKQQTIYLCFWGSYDVFSVCRPLIDKADI